MKKYVCIIKNSKSNYWGRKIRKESVREREHDCAQHQFLLSWQQPYESPFTACYDTVEGCGFCVLRGGNTICLSNREWHEEGSGSQYAACFTGDCTIFHTGSIMMDWCQLGRGIPESIKVSSWNLTEVKPVGLTFFFFTHIFSFDQICVNLQTPRATG